jgi:hypothetical protein
METFMLGVMILSATLGGHLFWCWHRDKVRDRSIEAFIVGQRKGHYQGWLAHARGIPLSSLPPTLKEIEQATGSNEVQGLSTYWFGYADDDRSAMWDCTVTAKRGDAAWKKWEARKVKELNEIYLGSDQRRS